MVSPNTTVQQICEYGDKNVDLKQIKKAFLPNEIGTDLSFKGAIVWKNVFAFIVLHLGALYGIYLSFVEVKWPTIIYFWLLSLISGMGVTAGAHRLFSHKSYKAAFSLRLVLVMLQTMAGQNCMYIWVRDHRQHHKYSDTDADPHNARRGFFFCHMGWLMVKKHPMVKVKGQTIDMSDLEADPLIVFQRDYYNFLYVVVAMILPIYLPVYCWDETPWNSLFISYFLRYVLVLHITWTVNSVAHFYGTKPYDENIVPVESIFVGAWSLGEGWHNYHHAFPWDYKASEFGTPINFTSFLIELLAYFGLAYDLKEASIDLIKKRAKRTGDGSHGVYGSVNKKILHMKIPEDGDIKETNKIRREVPFEPILMWG